MCSACPLSTNSAIDGEVETWKSFNRTSEVANKNSHHNCSAILVENVHHVWRTTTRSSSTMPIWELLGSLLSACRCFRLKYVQPVRDHLPCWTASGCPSASAGTRCDRARSTSSDGTMPWLFQASAKFNQQKNSTLVHFISQTPPRVCRRCFYNSTPSSKMALEAAPRVVRTSKTLIIYQQKSLKFQARTVICFKVVFRS